MPSTDFTLYHYPIFIPDFLYMTIHSAVVVSVIHSSYRTDVLGEYKDLNEAIKARKLGEEKYFEPFLREHNFYNQNTGKEQ